ncbi:MAG: hypothetical protein PHH13_03630 [Candidatus Peribacteraceae bacterium]|nr:hypothetical protein [Candidatus Peribacteraceae bacterium]
MKTSKVLSLFSPLLAASAIAFMTFAGTAAARTGIIHLDAHGCAKPTERWCVFQRRCIQKTAQCKKLSVFVAPHCNPKRCSDGRVFPTCSAAGFTLNYSVDPCKNLTSSSSSFASSESSTSSSSSSSISVKCVGCDRDAHGCYTSAGYTWCAPRNRCVRPWKEPCR